MFDTPLSPPTIDPATIEHYVAKGRRERSQAFAAMIRSLFRAPEPKPVATADCPA